MVNDFSFIFTHLTNPATTVLQERSGFATFKMKMDGSSYFVLSANRMIPDILQREACKSYKAIP